MRSLLLGCGNSRVRKVSLTAMSEWAGDLRTLDMDPECGADVIWNLEKLPLPFMSNDWDELGAYDVLEHFGQQGDWKAWFDFMGECHRILKVDGLFGIIVPIGMDAFADPGHTRFFGANHFWMLNQKWYAVQLEKGLQVTDYRWYWKQNFDIIAANQMGDHHLAFMLRKT